MKMKNLKEYINEGFRLGKNKVMTSTEKTIKPHSKEELQEILKKRIANDSDADLNDIDVTNITNMSELFSGLGFDYREKIGNIDISEWDMSLVENTYAMFRGCSNFNCNLSDWKLNKVVNAEQMFSGCTTFNSDVSNWNLDSLFYAKYMFANCTYFEGKGLDTWDLPNLTDATFMFMNCKKLKADFRHCTFYKDCNMSHMFEKCDRNNLILSQYFYDPNKKTHKINGDEFMFYIVWKILDQEGPMKKTEVLRKIGLKETSYATSFAMWNQSNIIISIKGGKLKAVPKNEWCKPIF